MKLIYRKTIHATPTNQSHPDTLRYNCIKMNMDSIMDETLSDLNELKGKLQDEIALVVYFSSPSCNVCHVLRPKLMEALEKKFPSIGRYHADVALTPEVAAEFQVFAAPTISVFLERTQNLYVKDVQ